jgi:Transposase DDE domain
MRSDLYPASPSFPDSFKKLVPFDQMNVIWRSCVSGRGAPGKLSGAELVMSLVYHFFCQTGTLASHVFRMTGIEMSNSALSQRRKNIPFALFEAIMKTALRPMANEQEQPEAFYRGLRLVAMDGTQFSLTNTPQVLSSLTKAAARRFQAAFAKVGVCVLVELGPHNPLAAAIGDKQESELVLAERLLAHLPQGCLLLADRLFGTGSTLAWIGEACRKAGGSHFLIRVRSNLKRRIVRIEKDGSAIIEVDLHDPNKQRRSLGTLLIREIRGRVHKPGRAWSEVRLWTSLLDAEAYPADELLPLYAKRWEHELYYKELKIDLRSSDLLQSHTLETAVQEIAALIVASALVARERSEVADGANVEPTRISFRKTRDLFDSLWFVIRAAEGLFSEDQLAQFVERTLQLICAEALLPPRRKRSCPRAVRQPIGKWPRLIENASAEGNLTIEILAIHV